MKLAVASLLLCVTATLADARRPPNCAYEPAYPKDLPDIGCAETIEKAPCDSCGAQDLSFKMLYAMRSADEVARSYAAGLTKLKWKVTRKGRELTAKHGHDQVSVTVTSGTPTSPKGATLVLVYKSA